MCLVCHLPRTFQNLPVKTSNFWVPYSTDSSSITMKSLILQLIVVLFVGVCQCILKIVTDIPKIGGKNPRQWEAYVCMEEPFIRSNTGRAVINRERFDQILAAFDRAQKVLYRNMCLDCLNEKCRSNQCRRPQVVQID